MNRALRRTQRRGCMWRKSGGGYATTGSLMPQTPANDWTFSVKQPVYQPYSDCGIPARPGQLFTDPNPALAQVAMVGGRRRGSKSRRQRGGAGCMTRRRQRGGAYNGVSIVPTSVGGSGPNVAALHVPVPCDARAGTFQRGGAYSSGNAYAAECYRAPGSQLPVYNATTAGFHFQPSTAIGGTLPDGVTAYNDVVPNAARVGGGKRRHRKHKKTYRKRR